MSVKNRLKNILSIAGVILLAAFVIAQFIQPNFSNPPVNEAETLEATTAVPPEVSAILNRSCTDCHSNNTRYPWYSKISPASWFMNNHIVEGRRELNFSIWATYSPKRKAKKLEEICEQVKEKEMPLPSYLWIHRDAALSADEITLLCDWANGLKATFESGAN